MVSLILEAKNLFLSIPFYTAVQEQHGIAFP